MILCEMAAIFAVDFLAIIVLLYIDAAIFDSLKLNFVKNKMWASLETHLCWPPCFFAASSGDAQASSADVLEDSYSEEAPPCPEESELSEILQENR